MAAEGSDQRQLLGLVEGLGSEIDWALNPGASACPYWGVGGGVLDPRRSDTAVILLGCN